MLERPLANASSRRTVLAVLAALSACGPQVELETDGASEGSTGGPGTTMATLGGTSPTDTADSSGGPADTGNVATAREVDVLFVVDNSGSMGEEQAKLASVVNILVAGLESASPPVDYRIGVTTTDNGNPWCSGTSPEGGQLRATSCRQRTEEFVFNGAQTIDATQAACFDGCSLENLGLDQNWIEVSPSSGTSNVINGSIEENLRCMLPQGINGCGFEAQLESMWKAIRRSETDNDASFGFHRPEALLTVVIVSDEVDCSYNSEFETIFLPDGNRVFWSDPDDGAPSSAVCWNAGVSCSGSSPYDCRPESYDVNGNPGVDGDQAVLRPIERYTDELRARGAYVFGIDGVSTAGSVVYADALDPQYQRDYGIGPGCENGGQYGVPPVRMRGLIDTVSGPGNESSVCDANYGVAMNTLVGGILARLP